MAKENNSFLYKKDAAKRTEVREFSSEKSRTAVHLPPVLNFFDRREKREGGIENTSLLHKKNGEASKNEGVFLRERHLLEIQESCLSPHSPKFLILCNRIEKRTRRRQKTTVFCVKKIRRSKQK